MNQVRWTVDRMPDLTGQVVVVTGANSGVGFEAAKQFAGSRARVVMACRNVQKAERALAELLEAQPVADVEIMQLDLASLKSVRAFADRFRSQFERLDILLNNAGIMMVPYGHTEDGFERQFGTNHLGHFALVGQLIDVIGSTPDARVVNVSSIGHRQGAVDFDDMMYADGSGYTPMQAYGRSKLANLLFTYELQRRFELYHVDATAMAAHPGITRTNLLDHLFEKYHVGFLNRLMGLFLQSPAMGALPLLRASVEREAPGGSYFGPDGRGERAGYPVVVESSAASHSASHARRLWQLSERLTGVVYLSGERQTVGA